MNRGLTLIAILAGALLPGAALAQVTALGRDYGRVSVYLVAAGDKVMRIDLAGRRGPGREVVLGADCLALVAVGTVSVGPTPQVRLGLPHNIGAAKGVARAKAFAAAQKLKPNACQLRGLQVVLGQVARGDEISVPVG